MAKQQSPKDFVSSLTPAQREEVRKLLEVTTARDPQLEAAKRPVAEQKEILREIQKTSSVATMPVPASREGDLRVGRVELPGNKIDIEKTAAKHGETALPPAPGTSRHETPNKQQQAEIDSVDIGSYLNVSGGKSVPVGPDRMSEAELFAPTEPTPLPRHAGEIDTNPANYAHGDHDPEYLKAIGEPVLPPPADRLNTRPPKAPLDRMLTLAEQSGPARRDELDLFKAAEAKGVKDDSTGAVSLSGATSAICPKPLREAQPDAYRPYEILNRRIREFLKNPALKAAGGVAMRVEFKQVDNPTLDTSDMRVAGCHPHLISGRILRESSSKLFIGYAQPGTETLTNILREVLTLIRDWSLGKEVRTVPAMNAERSMQRNDGSIIRNPDGGIPRPADRIDYAPKIRIYTPYDYPEQVAVVVA